jgi:hypothetical protein
VFSKPPVVLINPIKCARGVLKLPKIKSHLWLVKAVFSGRDVFGGNAEWKGVKRASILCHGKLWPISQKSNAFDMATEGVAFSTSIGMISI